MKARAKWIGVVLLISSPTLTGCVAPALMTASSGDAFEVAATRTLTVGMSPEEVRKILNAAPNSIGRTYDNEVWWRYRFVKTSSSAIVGGIPLLAGGTGRYSEQGALVNLYFDANGQKMIRFTIDIYGEENYKP
jgi:hypothetical protein